MSATFLRGLKLMDITGQTRIVGVIGWPLTYTLSPTMHNPAIEKAGLEYIYVAYPIHPDHVEEAVLGLRHCGIRGLNVTIPHKEAVLPLMDHLSVEAEALGAVNTIRIDDEGMWGGNTDVYGFTTALGDEGCKMAGKRVAVAGAGGAGRAMVAAALLEGAASVAVWDLDEARSQALVEHFQKGSLPHDRVVRCVNDDDRCNALAECDLFANASPVGMNENDPSPVDVSALADGCFVFDAVYNIPQTTLLREANARGLTAIGGLTMLMYQGAKSFEIWFGVKPDTDLMLKHLRNALNL